MDWHEDRNTSKCNLDVEIRGLHFQPEAEIRFANSLAPGLARECHAMRCRHQLVVQQELHPRPVRGTRTCSPFQKTTYRNITSDSWKRQITITSHQIPAKVQISITSHLIVLKIKITGTSFKGHRRRHRHRHRHPYIIMIVVIIFSIIIKISTVVGSSLIIIIIIIISIIIFIIVIIVKTIVIVIIDTIVILIRSITSRIIVLAIIIVVSCFRFAWNDDG